MNNAFEPCRPAGKYRRDVALEPLSERSASGRPGSHSEADVPLSCEWSGPAKTGPDHATLLHALKTEGLFRPA
jgi:hypothetical protein